MNHANIQAGSPLLQDFTATYFTLRVALCLMAFALPIAVYFTGAALQHLPLLPSISAYYYTQAHAIMIGTLWAVGISLFAYRGFTANENIALKIGGVLACCIATFAMPLESAIHDFMVCAQMDVERLNFYPQPIDSSLSLIQRKYLHFGSAVAFYGVLAYAMCFCSHATLHLVGNRAVRRFFLALYPSLGALFFVSMLFAFIYPQNDACSHNIIAVEIAGVYFFSVYWLAKTIECRKYDTDMKLRGEIHSSRATARRFRDLWR